MAVPTELELELKILVDKEKSCVLFAEVDGDFVNCLFSFLAFPLGTIARLVGKAQSQPITVGCFNTLYESVMNLDKQHFCTETCQDILLKEEFRKLKINIDDTEPTKYFVCPSYSFYPMCTGFSIYNGTDRCPNCRKMRNNLTTLEALSCGSGARKYGVFVTKATKFIVTDDLHVMPLILGTAIGHLYKLGIQDADMVEERTVKLGLNQLLDLLKWTLVSKNPLTDLFVVKRELPDRSLPKCDLFLQIKTQPFDQNQEVGKLNVKVMLKKANKEVLFVEAHQEFIDFLFGFLTIPLVELLHILNGKSCLGSLDILYNSALALDSQYFLSENAKKILLRPKCSPYYKRKKQLIPSETNHGSYIMEGAMKSIVNPKLPNDDDTSIGNEKLEGFMKGPALFIVEDNLVVTPFSTASALSIIKRNKCSLSDLEERTLGLGITEFVSILKASLYSTSTLTNGLSHTLNLKEPKQEI